MTLTPKERVLLAIDHEEPDRVPIVITGIQMKAYRELKKLAGIKAPDNYTYQWPELGLAEIDEETMQRLHADVRSVRDLEPEHIRLRNQTRDPHSPYVDSWGSGQIETAEGEWTPGINPLKEAMTIDDIENYSWPNMDDPTRVAHVRAQAKQLAEENQYAILGTPWLLFPFERAIKMQGMDTFLLNMAIAPDFAKALLAKITACCKRLMGNFLKEAGDYLDMIQIGDDLGTQESLLISPKMYREMLKPFHADLIAHIKQHTAAKVFFHTDGDVFNLIEDLIEIGVDILNPVQTSAGQMSNLEKLKAQFGERITFCGAIDTHNVLPNGNPKVVKDEVRRVISALGAGGGYILTSVHTIMNDVPAENVIAMVDAVENYGHYPLER